MQRTISVKIDVPEEFGEYLALCNTIYNRYIEWAFENKTYSKATAHKELYSKFRTDFPTIPSAMIQSIRDTAMEAVKALKFKFKPIKKAHSSIRYDSRTLTLRGDQLSISWSGENRIKQIINIPKFFKDRTANWKCQSATVGYDTKKKQFKANLIFQTETPAIISGDRFVGIDRGLYNIVSLSDGFRVASAHIRRNKRKVLFQKKRLQAKGTRSAIRKLKRLSGYEKRFSLNENHRISKLLAAMPYDVFVLEDLSGIRKQQSKGKKLNKWLSNWSFFQLEQLLTYKAEAIGKIVVKEDARYTSQKCSNCGIIDKKNRNGSHYYCERCGYRDHADINAAKNIRNNYLISVATAELQKQNEQRKTEQAMCQLAECSG